MALFNQLERRPVTLFSSEDKGAPQLAPTAGSLKTVLKACLVDGYGSKAGLGWEMLQETATSAVFKSKDPTACGAGVFIDNEFIRLAKIKIAYGNEMNGRADVDGGVFPYLGGSVERGQWRLVGHNKAAMLIVENTAYRDERMSIMMFFGDFPSIAPADTGNFIIWLGYVSTYYSDNRGYIASTQESPKGAEGNAWLTYYKSFDGLTVGPKGSVASVFADHRSVRYPDPITSGLMASEVYLQEYINDNEGKPLRGLWPGLYLCSCDLTGKPLFSIFKGFDGTDDEYLMFLLYRYSSGKYGQFPFLVNTTAWLA